MRKFLSRKNCAFFKKTTAVLSIAALCLTMSITDVATGCKKVHAAATSNSTLIWSDEFNGNSLDTSKWTAEIGNGASGWGNNEYEYYTDRPENLSVSDGALHITARNESYNGYNFTSARIKTQDKFYFKYGHVEARMALPSCQGIWPAFWMLGQDIGSVGWPKCGEIDIMEAVNAENKVYGTCHWDSNGYATYGTSSGTFDITQYHVYTLDWDDQYIRTYVDGVKYYEIYIGGGTGGTEELHNPYFLLFNVAVCGNWPGFSADTSKFPQEMKVDYIRVYQDNINYTSTSGNSVDNGGSSSTSFTAGTQYKITSRRSGKALDVAWGDPADGTNILQYTYNGTSNQKWYLESTGDGYYVLKNVATGKVVDVNGNSKSAGANIHQWYANGGQNQQWKIEPTSDGYYKITARSSGMCIDVEGGSSADNANVIQWNYNGGTNQQWKIEVAN